MLELKLLYPWAHHLHVFLLAEDTKCEDKHWIGQVDAYHAVVAALVHKDNIIAEHDCKSFQLCELQSTALYYWGSTPTGDLPEIVCIAQCQVAGQLHEIVVRVEVGDHRCSQ